MKLFVIVFFLLLSNSLSAKEFEHCTFLDEIEEEIVWYDFESAIDLCNENKKPIFIDIYTDWCGWCKKMDNSTFKDPSIVEYMNDNFYAVKMDAESKEPIAFREVLYEYKIYNNKTGYNELAVNLMGGKMSFPTFVILSKRQVKVGMINGYQKPVELIKHLKKHAK